MRLSAMSMPKVLGLRSNVYRQVEGPNRSRSQHCHPLGLIDRHLGLSTIGGTIVHAIYQNLYQKYLVLMKSLRHVQILMPKSHPGAIGLVSGHYKKSVVLLIEN